MKLRVIKRRTVSALGSDHRPSGWVKFIHPDLAEDIRKNGIGQVEQITNFFGPAVIRTMERASD